MRRPKRLELGRGLALQVRAEPGQECRVPNPRLRDTAGETERLDQPDVRRARRREGTGSNGPPIRSPDPSRLVPRTAAASRSSAKPSDRRRVSRSTSSQMRSVSPPASSMPARKSPSHHATASSSLPAAIAVSNSLTSRPQPGGPAAPVPLRLSVPHPLPASARAGPAATTAAPGPRRGPPTAGRPARPADTGRGAFRARYASRARSFLPARQVARRPLEPGLAQGSKQHRRQFATAVRAMV